MHIYQPQTIPRGSCITDMVDVWQVYLQGQKTRPSRQGCQHSVFAGSRSEAQARNPYRDM